MAPQTDIPSDLTDDQKAFMFQFLDAELNSEILYALLHDEHRCLAYTLAFSLSHCGIYSSTNVGPSDELCNTLGWVKDIAACLSTILSDSYIIWCCWMVWGWCWLVVLLPIISLVAAIGIVSALIYTFMLMLLLVLGMDCQVDWEFITSLFKYWWNPQLSIQLDYFDIMVDITKGVAPTLLGQAAAGHTCPREDNNESTVSSLHFQTPSELGITSSQHEESTSQSSVLAMDIEAQLEQQAIFIEENTMVSMTSQADNSD
ncbi:hypothetical protein ARMGADRAFT_1026728 [Armillaria gallica]|uniref:Uncharacterized protein n=1 Tax=Armillaria gallica TaxID=47427 RepID=A0A2H3EHT2_ARMGA|nr:hypothetical protein ARMGADRAFT_1026728 [Armillaria gallica]